MVTALCFVASVLAKVALSYTLGDLFTMPGSALALVFATDFVLNQILKGWLKFTGIVASTDRTEALVIGQSTAPTGWAILDSVTR